MAVDIVYETHAVTTDNEAGLATGWLPGQLSPQGRALAEQLGRRRRADGLIAVFVSDLRRAVETAEIAFRGSRDADLPGRAAARVQLRQAQRHAGERC